MVHLQTESECPGLRSGATVRSAAGKRARLDSTLHRFKPAGE